MSFQAYLETVKQKTGKTPADFSRLAAKAGHTRHTEIVNWLKTEFVLGHGHANALAAVLLRSESRKLSPEAKLAALFTGKKARWRPCVDELLATVLRFGPEVVASPNETYLNLLKGKKKFGLVQPGSGERLDLGLKLKGVPPEGRFEAAGTWNAMVTHRVRVADPLEIDAEVLAWLRRAHDAA